jgi:SAM-dependent methyltransferase
MVSYAWLYRLGITPWERYREAAADSVAVLLDREQAERAPPLGRALDLGCGRGRYTPELARRGWEAVGIDAVPSAIEAAQRLGSEGVTYVVGDVTDPPEALGTFDFFLDIGCIGGLGPTPRLAAGQAVTRLASPAATLLLLAFGPNRMPFVDGVSQAEVEETFPEWDLMSVDAAQTAGLGWPMKRTSPTWYRLQRRT